MDSMDSFVTDPSLKFLSPEFYKNGVLVFTSQMLKPYDMEQLLSTIKKIDVPIEWYYHNYTIYVFTTSLGREARVLKTTLIRLRSYWGDNFYQKMEALHSYPLY